MEKKIDRLLGQAVNLYQQRLFTQSKLTLLKILEKDSTNLPALEILGLLSISQKKEDEAVNYLQRACEINPNSFSIQFNLAKVLSESGHDHTAIIHHKAALQINPNSVDALINYGKSLTNLGNLDEALQVFKNAFLINKNDHRVLLNIARIYNNQKEFQKAIDLLNTAVNSDPKNADIWLTRGVAYKGLMQFKTAYINYQQAIKLDINLPQAYYDLAILNLVQHQYTEAIENFSEAIIRNPDYADAYFGRGATYKEIREFQKSLNDFKKAIDLNKNVEWLPGNYMHVKMHICDWTDFETNINSLKEAAYNKNALDPFQALSLFDDPELHLVAAKKYSKIFAPLVFDYKSQEKNNNKKIKIGYYSPDFREHPVARLISGVFREHDKEKFEIIAFSFAPREDHLTVELSQFFDQFINVNDLSDEEVSKISKELHIDIAIDLCGYTSSARPNIFSYRAAPIQVNYLGYPGTLGSHNYDYIIADEIVAPKENWGYYIEKFAILPNSYQANDNKKIVDIQISRASLNLPENSFVFCCFNNNYKILPSVFTLWLDILKRVDGSVLWLLEDNPHSVANLKTYAEQANLDSGRIIFAKRVPVEQHMARQQCADLFLDTFPYNAHTTASDALWANVPIITMTGKTFASRVAASLLNAVGLPELITNSLDDYKALAIELAQDTKKIETIKRKLSINKLQSPLFNTSLFTDHLETLYTKIHNRQISGQLPETITVY